MSGCELSTLKSWWFAVRAAYQVPVQEEYALQVDPFAPVITFIKLWAAEEGEESTFEVDFLKDAVRACMHACA